MLSFASRLFTRPSGPFLGLVAFAIALAAMLPARAAGDEPPSDEREPEIVEDVVVTATRAEDDAPVPHSNVSGERLREEYATQDIPELMRLTPSVFAYTDAGNGVGYSYMSVRGFDQRRVAVTINGVPLNGAEVHQVYWVNLPAFAQVIEDVQVQRGVGKSNYGPAAIGGRLNIETWRLGEGGERIAAEALYGSFDTSRLHVAWRAPATDEGWIFGAAASRMASDGYRENSWSRMGSAFLTAQRSTPDSAWRVNLFGGREELHLAFEGLTRDQLAEDRRANPADPGETDEFTQLHLHVINEWTPRSGLAVDNTFYAIYGNGSFELFDETIGIPSIDESFENANRTLTIDQWDFGWIPRASFDLGSGTLNVGGELRVHRGTNYGDVRGRVDGSTENARYYDYDVPKTSWSAFVEHEWEATGRLTVVSALHYVRHSWSFDETVEDTRYDVSYSWWAPRVGASLDVGRGTTAFASISQAGREPATTDLFSPEFPGAAPAFRERRADGELVGPVFEEERVTDYELGLSYESPRLAGSVTLYEMRFDDEIVLTGALDPSTGLPIRGNAGESFHRGIELAARALLAPGWAVDGHLTLSRDEHVRFDEAVFSPEPAIVDRSGNRVAGFPERTGRLAVVHEPRWGRVELGAYHTGRIYIDNSETEAISVDPWTSAHLDLRVDLPAIAEGLSVRTRVENLFDEEYETFGFLWSDEPTFIPAADRSVSVILAYRP
jgi:iron complex outermembrane receptor protein